MTRAVGAALRSGAELCRAATQPGFAILGCGAILSDEINATESNNQLIWTALVASIWYFPTGLNPKLRVIQGTSYEEDSTLVDGDHHASACLVRQGQLRAGQTGQVHSEGAGRARVL